MLFFFCFSARKRCGYLLCKVNISCLAEPRQTFSTKLCKFFNFLTTTSLFRLFSLLSFIALQCIFCTKSNLLNAQRPTICAALKTQQVLQAASQQTYFNATSKQPPLTFETRVCLCLVECWAIQSRLTDFLNFIYVQNIQQTVSITNFPLCEMTTS